VDAKMAVNRSAGIKMPGYLSYLITILVGAAISFLGLALALSWDRQMIRTEFAEEAENCLETIKREIELKVLKISIDRNSKLLLNLTY
jgi:hypothetical protein